MDEKILRLYVNTAQNAAINGSFGGAWISLPMDEDELQSQLDAIHKLTGCEQEPHWRIEQHEWEHDVLGQLTKWYDYEIGVINKLCEEFVNMHEEDQMRLYAILDAIEKDFEDAIYMMDNYDFYPGETIESRAQDEVDFAIDNRDYDWIREHIDYSSIEDDLRDSYTESIYGLLY